MPIGVESAKDIVASSYCYVDKTLFIKKLLDLKGKMNLFARPRHFGKTTNPSMLQYFFEHTGNIRMNTQNYEVENRFPTIKEWYDRYLFGSTKVL